MFQSRDCDLLTVGCFILAPNMSSIVIAKKLNFAFTRPWILLEIVTIKLKNIFFFAKSYMGLMWYILIMRVLRKIRDFNYWRWKSELIVLLHTWVSAAVRNLWSCYLVNKDSFAILLTILRAASCKILRGTADFGLFSWLALVIHFLMTYLTVLTGSRSSLGFLR